MNEFLIPRFLEISSFLEFPNSWDLKYTWWNVQSVISSRCLPMLSRIYTYIYKMANQIRVHNTVVRGATYKSTIWHVHCFLWLSKVGMQWRKNDSYEHHRVESIGDNEFINQIGFSPMERATNVSYVDFVQRSGIRQQDLQGLILRS